MVKFVVVFLAFALISTTYAGYGGGGGGGGGGGKGGKGKGGKGGGKGGKGKGGKGCKKCGGGGDTPDIIQAAVISKQTIQLKPFTSSSQQANVPTIVISSGSSPLNIQFQSASSNLNITQDHSGSKPQTITSNSVDGGIVLKHTVKKPIIQNVHEIIMPQRKIVQEIMPVKEFIKTIISQEQTQSTTEGSDETTTEESTTPKPSKKKYKKKKKSKKTTTTEAADTTEASTEASSTSTEADSTTAEYMIYGRR